MNPMRDAMLLLVLLVLAASVRVSDKPAPVAEFSRAGIVPSFELTAVPQGRDALSPEAPSPDGSELVLAIPGISEPMLVKSDGGEVLIVLKPIPASVQIRRAVAETRHAVAVHARPGSCLGEPSEAGLEEHARRVLILLEVERDRIQRRVRSFDASRKLGKA